MRIKVMFSIILLISLLIMGCTKDKPPSMTQTFIGGNVGLNMYFQEGMPPPAIYDGGNYPFGVDVVIENAGEADIGPGTENPFAQVRLEGILPENYGLTPADFEQNLQIPLAGSHRNFDGTILPGQTTDIIFENLNFLADLAGNQQTTIRAVACYDYQNFAVTKLCFRRDMLEGVQDVSICSARGPKDIANSGGPLQITKVIQNPLGENRVQVTFTIEHMGTGEFFSRLENETCDPSVRNPNKYRLEVIVHGMNNENAQVNCPRLGGTEGIVTLYNGAPQTITCSVEEESPVRIFEDTLTIELRYRYSEFIEQPIIIQAIPEVNPNLG